MLVPHFCQTHFLDVSFSVEAISNFPISVSYASSWQMALLFTCILLFADISIIHLYFTICRYVLFSVGKWWYQIDSQIVH
jgi:hypothetical protein